VAGFGIYSYINVSEGDIRKKFDCGRETLDEKTTDIYCRYPEYYSEDIKNDSLIEDSDWDDPLYIQRMDKWKQELEDRRTKETN